MASSPDTSNGWIVWEQDCPSGQSFIAAYRYATGEELLTPNVSYKAHMPGIDGNLVAWVEGDALNPSDIYYTDLSVRPLAAHRIPAGYSEKWNPSVNGTRIVWQNRLPGLPDYDIMMYDLSSARVYNLTPFLDGSNQQSPSISGQYIIWEDSRNATEIHYNNTLDWSDNLVPADPGGSLPAMPVIQGDSITWHSDTSDIFLFNIPTHTLTQLTADGTGTNQLTPSLYSTYLVWKDDQYVIPPGFGIYDITYTELDPPLTERITDADTIVVVSTDTNWRPRITSDDRIFWQDIRDAGSAEIYMFSRNINEPCSAGFIAPSTGSRNNPVSFTDTSTGTINHFSWNFGDGSMSTDQNPTHVYTTGGTYPVTLTVSNPYCRDRTASWPVAIDDMPAAGFSSNITTGMVPLNVQFTNTSTGWQTGLDWDFGDGIDTNLTTANPIHTYSNGGRYNVLLFASNDYGTDTERKISYIHALSGGTQTLSTNIAGITITTNAGQQHLNFDTGIISDYFFNPANNTVLTCIPVPGYGISQITFYSPDRTGFSQVGSTISGTVSRTNLMSDLLHLTDFSDPTLGTLSTMNYTLDYQGFPSVATITTNVYDDTLPDYGSLSNAVHYNSFTSANGIPYIIQFVKTNITAPHRAVIRMSADSAWTAAHSWRTDHIYAIRVDGSYGEILPSTFLMHDVGNNLDYYTTTSPHGLSKFAFSDLSGSGNVFQMVYLGVQEHFGSPSPDAEGTDISGQPGTGQGLASQQNQPELNQPLEKPPAPTVTSVDLYINGQGVVTQTTTLKSADNLATIAIGKGVTAFNADGNPLSSVSIETLSADNLAGMPAPGTLSFAGLSYNFQPDSATFSPAVTITFAVPEAQWNQQYAIREFDTTTGSWIDLPTTYNPESGTISASVSHFCCIALFSSDVPAQARVTVVKTMAAPPETIPTPAPSSHIGIFYNMFAILTAILLKNMYLVLILIAIITAFYLKGRRGRLDKIRYNMK